MACPFQEEWFLERGGHCQMTPKDASSSTKTMLERSLNDAWMVSPIVGDYAGSGAHTEATPIVAPKIQRRQTTPKRLYDPLKRHHNNALPGGVAGNACSSAKTMFFLLPSDALQRRRGNDACSAFSDHKTDAKTEGMPRQTIGERRRQLRPHQISIDSGATTLFSDR